MSPQTARSIAAFLQVGSWTFMLLKVMADRRHWRSAFLFGVRSVYNGGHAVACFPLEVIVMAQLS